MGLTPDGWGPYFWATIHLTALGAPFTLDSTQVSGYRSFYNALPWVIPCQSCAEHLKETLKKIPLTEEVLKGTDSLFAWTVELHNQVNQLLGKSHVSLEQAKIFWMKVAENRYPPFREDRPKDNGVSKIIWIGIIILLIGVIVFWSSKKTGFSKRRS
jgi:hypothetical protein